MRSNSCFFSFVPDYYKKNSGDGNYYDQKINRPKIGNRPGDNIVKPFNNRNDHVFNTIFFQKKIRIYNCTGKKIQFSRKHGVIL